MNVLREEELFWFQKSRQKWVVDGDRNTRFYHLSTVMRRSTNKVVRLQNDAKAWVSEPEELKFMACNFFKYLFAEDIVNRRWITSGNLWPQFSSGDHDQLSRIPNEYEIKQTVFSMGAFKAPGSDGFPAVFFHKNWNRIKAQVCSLVLQVWAYPDLLASINSTLLVLLPKVQNPSHINQFRPISLCPVLYKIISKLVVNCLKPIMVKVISPAQTSFVPQRHIQDNIIVVQELVHSMRKMRGKRCFMAVKVDLEKKHMIA